MNEINYLDILSWGAWIVVLIFALAVFVFILFIFKWKKEAFENLNRLKGACESIERRVDELQERIKTYDSISLMDTAIEARTKWLTKKVIH